MKPDRSVLSHRGHIRPGKRGSSVELPTPRLGTGQLTPNQLLQIENCAAKIPYTARCVAETAAIAIGWCGIDLKAYRCPVCDLWHLTKASSD